VCKWVCKGLKGLRLEAVGVCCALCYVERDKNRSLSTLAIYAGEPSYSRVHYSKALSIPLKACCIALSGKSCATLCQRVFIDSWLLTSVSVTQIQDNAQAKSGEACCHMANAPTQPISQHHSTTDAASL
jgi:hypothetical protein